MYRSSQSPAGAVRVADKNTIPDEEKIVAEKPRKPLRSQSGRLHHCHGDKGPLVVEGIQRQAFGNERLEFFLRGGKGQYERSFEEGFDGKRMVLQLLQE